MKFSWRAIVPEVFFFFLWEGKSYVKNAQYFLKYQRFSKTFRGRFFFPGN